MLFLLRVRGVVSPKASVQSGGAAGGCGAAAAAADDDDDDAVLSLNM